MHCARLLLAISVAVPCSGQLTLSQKISDFNDLVAVFDRNYGPYEWKRDVIKFDLFGTQTWLDRIGKTTNDLDYYEVLVDYVAHLNDAHDAYILPSTFTASLGLSADIYDGKVLIDSINRTLLPAARFPFQIGDELVSVDGQKVQDLIQQLSKYAVAANPRSTARNAASFIGFRPQNLMPHAVDLGDSASLLIQRQDGSQQLFQVPWQKSGLPIGRVGPVPDPRKSVSRPASVDLRVNDFTGEPDYMAPLRDHRSSRLPIPLAILNFGSRTPVFTFPAGFTQRLGTRSTDLFFSGTFTAGGYKIGFIRIPTYQPSNTTTALNQFFGEIAFFQANTDGLIVDEMRNPGGDLLYVNEIAQLLIPYRFRSIIFNIRATSTWVESISQALTSAKATPGTPQYMIDQLQDIYHAITEANSGLRGDTGGLPLAYTAIDLDPFTDSNGKPIGYTKPLMVLVDEFSASAADIFAATIQDNQRGMLFGMRTLGAGGTVNTYSVGSYGEGFTTLTETMAVRKNPVVTDDYPTAPFIENIGVRPDIPYDYMTKDNLLQSGRSYVDAFTSAMIDWIKKNQ